MHSHSQSPLHRNLQAITKHDVERSPIKNDREKVTEGEARKRKRERKMKETALSLAHTLPPPHSLTLSPSLSLLFAVSVCLPSSFIFISLRGCAHPCKAAAFCADTSQAKLLIMGDTNVHWQRESGWRHPVRRR